MNSLYCNFMSYFRIRRKSKRSSRDQIRRASSMTKREVLRFCGAWGNDQTIKEIHVGWLGLEYFILLGAIAARYVSQWDSDSRDIKL